MKQKRDKVLEVSKIRDISDFYQNWEQFRPEISRLSETGNNLSDEQKEVLRWMVHLIDRIGEVDIN